MFSVPYLLKVTFCTITVNKYYIYNEDTSSTGHNLYLFNQPFATIFPCLGNTVEFLENASYRHFLLFHNVSTQSNPIIQANICVFVFNCFDLKPIVD